MLKKTVVRDTWVPYSQPTKGLDPSMPLGLAGLRELIRRRRPAAAAAAAVRPFYSNFDWLEGLASWPAAWPPGRPLTYYRTYSSLPVAAGTTDCLPAPPSWFPATHVSFFIGGGMLGPSGATL
jgi:hypothetical protein